MREWAADLRESAGELFVVLLCYLVLSACGWAIDHLMLEEPR